MLGSNAGGDWNESAYILEELMGRLSGEFNNDVIVSSWVSADDKNSERYILKVSLHISRINQCLMHSSTYDMNVYTCEGKTIATLILSMRQASADDRSKN